MVVVDEGANEDEKLLLRTTQSFSSNDQSIYSIPVEVIRVISNLDFIEVIKAENLIDSNCFCYSIVRGFLLFFGGAVMRYCDMMQYCMMGHYMIRQHIMGYSTMGYYLMGCCMMGCCMTGFLSFFFLKILIIYQTSE